MVGGGVPLPASLRAHFEARFGSSFSQVRLHTGGRAIAAARQLDAAAYALGHNIAFNDGFYAPHTGHGLRLLAHELVHVLQAEGLPPGKAGEREPLPAIASLEREAESAADAVGTGHTRVRQRMSQRIPLCHPVYISSHGDQGYLDGAAKFYKSWGYSPVHTGVKSVEAVLDDLSKQNSIDKVTLVSHARSDLLFMQFIDGGPEGVQKSDWSVDTIGALVNLERHNVDTLTVDQVIDYVKRADPKVLLPLGPLTDPFVRQFLWWSIEIDMADRAGYAAATSIEMKAIATSHAGIFRKRLHSSQGTGSPGVSDAALSAVETAVHAQAQRWAWKAPAVNEQQGLKQRLKDSPSAEVLRITDKPDFFMNLALVRQMVTNKSWIEIQGCTAGKDKGYLTAVQGFFGGTTTHPIVTAPDWYQVFGHYGFTAIDEGEARAQWKSKEVKDALALWAPIITNKQFRGKPTFDDFLAYLKKGHALPLSNPRATGGSRVLMLKTQATGAFVEWLSKHAYQIASEVDIRKTFFAGNDLAANVKGTQVDWLQDALSWPKAVAFKPSREYAKHIIRAP